MDKKICGRRGKWEELSESERIKYQSKLREQAIAAGMPEDLGAMSPPPKVSAATSALSAGLKTRRNGGMTGAEIDEARRLADMRIAKSHMAQIEAERQWKLRSGKGTSWKL